MKHFPEIDFVKGVLILLMVAFHLVYFSTLYPTAKDIVYTFHMPGFLVISGYLMNVEKAPRPFAKTLWRFFLPYLVLESAYIVMAAYLPIREHIDKLTCSVFCQKFFLHPLGPYWYLRILLLCGLPYYLVMRYMKNDLIVRLSVLGLFYFLFAQYTNALPLAYSLYFLAGVIIRQSGRALTAVIRPALFSIVMFFVLASFVFCRGCDTWGGAFMVYFSLSALLALYHYLPEKLREGMVFTGKHTLVIFLLSPIFTFAVKPLAHWFSFDPTGILFLSASLTACVIGSFILGKLLDFLHISPFIFGKKVAD